MAFTIGGLLAVMLEFLRPLLVPLSILVLADLAALGYIVRASTRPAWRTAIRLSVLVGAVMAVLVFLVGPAWTGASLGQLTGVLDYLALFAAALGLGAATGVLLYPLIQILLWQRVPRT